MIRFRFSIAGLIALVGIAAFGFAAIRVASPGWAGGMLSLSILALLTSLLGVAFRRGRKRVFWVGFALFGWAHLILAFAPWFDTHVGPLLFGVKLFDELFPRVHTASSSGMGGMGGMGGGMGGGFRQMGMGPMAPGMGGGAPAAPGRLVDLDDFEKIGLSLETLLWAFLGGWTALYLSSGREPREPGPRPQGEAGAGSVPLV